MKDTVEAKYYDGISSATRQASVLINITMKVIHLQTVDGFSVFWKLEDLQFEQYGNLLEIRNKKYPDTLLKIDDKHFSEKFYSVMYSEKYIDRHTLLLNLGLSRIILMTICVFSILLYSYIYILPPIAEKSAILLPESFDNKIGDLFMNDYTSLVVIDSIRTKHLERFATELDLKNKKHLQFSVVESNQVNAFALPNGQIVVYTGILKNMKNSDELVSLLAHEASHINHRHSIKILCKNLTRYMLTSLLFNDVNGIMAVITENAHQLQTLSYSREFEEEADREGLTILMENNINPNGIIRLFEQLDNEHEDSVPELISTHPLTKHRIENMQKIILETKYKISPNNKLDSIFQHIKN